MTEAGCGRSRTGLPPLTDPWGEGAGCMYEPGGLAVAACIQGAANEVLKQVDDRAKRRFFYVMKLNL